MVAILAVLPGCVTSNRQNVTPSVSGSQTASASLGIYRRLVAQYEADQQLPQALFMWRVIASIDPGDSTARQRITQLRLTMETESRLHLARGKEHFDRKSFQGARREFALALACNPYVEEAADHLRRLSVEEELVEYRIRTGDSPERIAQTVYCDGSKQFVVAYFADTGSDKELKPGGILRLPAPEQEMKAKSVHLPKPYTAGGEVHRVYDKSGAEAHYGKGIACYLAQQFQEAVNEWEETLRLDPEHPNARRDIQKARTMLRKARLK
jgi:tetratricopeptide (TPR) repeat protein